MSKKKLIGALAALAVVLGLVAVCLVCTKQGNAEIEEFSDPVVRRMHDKVYVAKLEEQLERRKQILKGLADAKSKLDAAKASGAAESELEKLQAEVEAWAKNFKDNQRLSEQIVRNQMLESTADQKKQLQQKGN